MNTVTLPMPPSTNRLWRMFKGHMVASEEAKSFKVSAGWIVRGMQCAMLTGPLRVYIDIYREAKRGDLDNKIKIILDSLQGIWFENDAQVVEIHARMFDDKSNPRAVVSVEMVSA
jgi:Holliday junction resolvase RusA-like endonuclease